jgi:hypothetical protein
VAPVLPTVPPKLPTVPPVLPTVPVEPPGAKVVVPALDDRLVVPAVELADWPTGEIIPLDVPPGEVTSPALRHRRHSSNSIRGCADSRLNGRFLNDMLNRFESITTSC